MTEKIYEYKGKIYCEEDLSMEHDNYGGDLYDLYWELKKDGKANEITEYYTYGSELYYDSPEELIEEEFSNLRSAIKSL